MPKAFRLSVPKEVAEDLLREGSAVRPLNTRGAGIGEVIHFLVDGVNTGASIVTVAAAAAALRRISSSLARYLRRSQRDSASTVVIRGPQGERSLQIDARDGLERVTEQLRVALESVRSEAAKPTN